MSWWKKYRIRLLRNRRNSKRNNKLEGKYSRKINQIKKLSNNVYSDNDLNVIGNKYDYLEDKLKNNNRLKKKYRNKYYYDREKKRYVRLNRQMNKSKRIISKASDTYNDLNNIRAFENFVDNNDIAEEINKTNSSYNELREDNLKYELLKNYKQKTINVLGGMLVIVIVLSVLLIFLSKNTNNHNNIKFIMFTLCINLLLVFFYIYDYRLTGKYNFIPWTDIILLLSFVIGIYSIKKTY